MIFGGSGRARRIAVAAVALGVLAGCTADDSADPGAQPPATAEATPQATPTAEPTAEPTPEPTPQPSAEPTSGPGPALVLLDTLAVKGRAPLTDYDRDRFGQAWADVDRNGCDTRNDVLRRDLAATVLKPGTNDCVVLSGELASDPYTGDRIAFARADSTVDIDHVVALADAWQKGAAGWDERKRVAFGNDPLNLLAVDENANRQKGASDAASWLPANTAYRCAYVARQVAVKAKYEVWVTAAERDALARVLGDCPGENVPSSDAPVLAPEGLGVVPAAAPAPEPQPQQADPAPDTSPDTPSDAATDPQFRYCYEAMDAGYGPYVRGVDPEYDWYRDADSDGRVCE